MVSVDYMLSSLRPKSRKGAARKERAGRNIIRGASGRGYDFEAYSVAEAAEFVGTACVYIFARNVSANTMHAMGEDASAKDFSLGYAAVTDDLARAAARHEAAGHFKGYSFDTILTVRVGSERIRNEIVEDVIALHRPVLNDLLGSHERGLRD